MPAAEGAVLVVPDEAVIADGSHTRVIVAKDGDRFVAVPVSLGHAAGGLTEIRDGLTAGQRVVVSGQFLIDSEANLSGALDRLDGTEQPAPAASAPASPSTSAMSAMPGMPMEHRP